MSESKWIEHYRAGAWTVGEVIEAGAAWIVAMDPDHYRLRFFPHRDAARFTVGIDAEWSDEKPVCSPDPHRGSRCGGRRHGDGVRHSESHRGLLLR